MIKGRAIIKVTGVNQLMLDFSRMQKIPAESKSAILMSLAQTFLNRLAKYAPIDSGNYLKSWGISNQTSESITISPGGPEKSYMRKGIGGGTTQSISPRQLAVILEYSGARPHIIKPKNPNGVLTFDWGGQQVWFTIVHHPGMKVQPHIRLAVRDVKNMGKGIVAAIIAGSMPVQKWKDSMINYARSFGYDGAVPPKQIGRHSIDTSANIGRGTRGAYGQRLSVGLSGKRIRPRGMTRMLGTSQHGRKAGANKGIRLPGQGTERSRSIGLVRSNT